MGRDTDSNPVPYFVSLALQREVRSNGGSPRAAAFLTAPVDHTGPAPFFVGSFIAYLSTRRHDSGQSKEFLFSQASFFCSVP